MLRTISKRRLLRDATLNVLPSLLLILVFFRRSGNFLLENHLQGGLFTLLFAIVGGELRDVDLF